MTPIGVPCAHKRNAEDRTESIDQFTLNERVLRIDLNVVDVNCSTLERSTRRTRCPSDQGVTGCRSLTQLKSCEKP